ITQVTHSGGFSIQPSISQDGRRIAFASDHNPVYPYSHNPNNRQDVFLAIQTTDWGFIKISRPLSGEDNDTGSSSSPSISANGSRIAFASNGNFVGQNANHLPQIYLAQVNDLGQLVALDQVTSVQSSATQYTNIEPSLSDTANGIRIAFVSDQDPASGTLLSHPEIFVWQKIGPSANFRRVTNSPDVTPCSNRGPSIGPNFGLRVAFSSDCNVTND